MTNQEKNETVHVLVRIVKFERDGIETSVDKFVTLFESEELAQRWLDENIRKPLHRQYETVEWEVNDEI